MHRYAFLNRQFIILLSALGIPDYIFTNMFGRQMKRLKGLAKRALELQLDGDELRMAAKTSHVRSSSC
jgi:hypothetical protein